MPARRSARPAAISAASPHAAAATRPCTGAGSPGRPRLRAIVEEVLHLLGEPADRDSRPCSSASGLGGQPGIHTSTGNDRVRRAPWVNGSGGRRRRARTHRWRPRPWVRASRRRSCARPRLERPDHRPGDHEQVGMPGRRGEEEAEPVQVVVRRGEQPDLLLADRAGPGVQRADVQAAAELRATVRRSSSKLSAAVCLVPSLARHADLPPSGMCLTSVRAGGRGQLELTAGRTAACGASARQRPQAVHAPTSKTSTSPSRPQRAARADRDQPVGQVSRSAHPAGTPAGSAAAAAEGSGLAG